jgi:hypothetical protein
MLGVKKKICFVLVISILTVSTSLDSVFSQENNDNSKWRTHKGEKEVDISGLLSFNNTNSGELSLSIGLYITDLIQLGVEGSINYDETKEIQENAFGEEISRKDRELTGSVSVFLNHYLRTKEVDRFEPFGGILAGIESRDKGKVDFIFGGTLGTKVYFTDNLGSFGQYRLKSNTKLDYSHEISFGLFYQFD